MHSPGAGEYRAAAPAPPAPPCARHPAPPALAPAAAMAGSPAGPVARVLRARSTASARRGSGPLGSPELVPGPQNSGLLRGAHIRLLRGSDRPWGGSGRPGAACAWAGRPVTLLPGIREARTAAEARTGGGAPWRKVWKREGKWYPLNLGRVCEAGHHRSHLA